MLKRAWNRSKQLVQQAGAVVTGMVITASAALATEPADPVVESFTALQDKITTYAVPLLALTVVAVGIGIGIKYLKKAKGAA